MHIHVECVPIVIIAKRWNHPRCLEGMNTENIVFIAKRKVKSWFRLGMGKMGTWENLLVQSR